MSEKNKSKDSKKWLISRLKTSGSKRRYVDTPDYIRPEKSIKDIEETLLPYSESMSTQSGFNNKINTDLLRRFLGRQVGRPWDEIYSEIIERIPKKLYDYKDCVFYYVANKVEIVNGELYDLRDSQMIIINRDQPRAYFPRCKYIDFYVDPTTHILEKVKDFPTRKVTKNMTKEELLAFRAKERAAALAEKNRHRLTSENKEELDRILAEKKRKKSEDD